LAKCPRCGAEIERLRYECKVWEFSDFYLASYTDSQGEHFCGEWDDWEYSDASDAKPRWYCPKCDKPLFAYQTTAEAFLMGKDVKVEVNVRGRLLPKQRKVEETVII